MRQAATRLGSGSPLFVFAFLGEGTVDHFDNTSHCRRWAWNAPCKLCRRRSASYGERIRWQETNWRPLVTDLPWIRSAALRLRIGLCLITACFVNSEELSELIHRLGLIRASELIDDQAQLMPCSTQDGDLDAGAYRRSAQPSLPNAPPGDCHCGVATSRTAGLPCRERHDPFLEHR